MFKKSCSLRYDRTLSPEQCAKDLAAVGFTHVFSTWGYADEGVRDVAAAHAAGLTVETLHAVYGGINEIWLDDQQGDARMGVLLSCIRSAAEMGVPTVIMHLSSGNTPPLPSEIGLRRFSRLCDEAERLGISVAFENLRKVEYLQYIFDHIDSPARKFCFDCGHENLYNGGNGVLEQFHGDLVAVHLHDNHGVTDDHLIPFEGSIDWVTLCTRFKRIGFSLPITLELKATGVGLPYAQRAFDAACRIEELLSK